MKNFSWMWLCLLAACAPEQKYLGESSQALAPTSALIGRGTFAGPIKVEREQEASHWEVELNSKKDLDVAVQTVTFPAGAQSTWHSHPGPVLITVASGTMTFYDGDDPNCTPIVRTAGQGFVDGGGDHPHIARNESDAPAMNVVVYFAPKLAALRVDQPSPGNCPF